MNKRQRSSTYRPKRRERSRSNNSHRSELEYRPSRDELKFITRLRTDLLEAVAERPDFARFSHTSADTTATILVRFGIETFNELRSTRADQRAHFIADAKKAYGFKSMKFLHEIFAAFPPVKKREEYRCNRI